MKVELKISFRPPRLHAPECTANRSKSAGSLCVGQAQPIIPRAPCWATASIPGWATPRACRSSSVWRRLTARRALCPALPAHRRRRVHPAPPRVHRRGLLGAGPDRLDPHHLGGHRRPAHGTTTDRRQGPVTVLCRPGLSPSTNSGMTMLRWVPERCGGKTQVSLHTTLFAL